LVANPLRRPALPQVQTITGKTRQIKCHPEDTIGDLKATVRELETSDDYHRAKGKVLPVHDDPKWQDMIHLIPGAEKPIQVAEMDLSPAEDGLAFDTTATGELQLGSSPFCGDPSTLKTPSQTLKKKPKQRHCLTP